MSLGGAGGGGGGGKEKKKITTKLKRRQKKKLHMYIWQFIPSNITSEHAKMLSHTQSLHLGHQGGSL